MKKYKHILVPLDGSDLAEQALDDALALAQMNEAEVTLLQVVPIIDMVTVVGEQTIMLEDQLQGREEAARRYLESLCDRISCSSALHRVVQTGDPAETIINYSREKPVDLIVMATHGRSGLQRWFLGSVADRVIRGAVLPVLVIRAQK